MGRGGGAAYYLVPVTKRMGLPHMRFQDLRNTYASMMLAAGFKAYELSRFLSHAAATTAVPVYGQEYPVDYDARSNRFERFVAGG